MITNEQLNELIILHSIDKDAAQALTSLHTQAAVVQTLRSEIQDLQDALQSESAARKHFESELKKLQAVRGKYNRRKARRLARLMINEGTVL